MSFQMYVPTRILFGAGALKQLSMQKMPGGKALVVISDGKSTKVNGYLDRVIKELEKADIETVLFDRIEANPLNATVMAGSAEARKNQCDFIVALGGGSVMDASKAIAAMATNDGDLWDYISGGTGKGIALKEKALPIIAITTTAGTGSEVDQWGVVSNPETNEKIGFGGYDCLFPVIAIVDPELMKTVPPIFTAYQGFDALFHSVECYISAAANQMGDMYALTAIEYIGKYLAQALGMTDAKKPEGFLTMLAKLQADCGVAELKMSDYGISDQEFDALAKNARETMGGLFACDRIALTDEECAAIFAASYR